jgi:hypothetical protein
LHPTRNGISRSGGLTEALITAKVENTGVQPSPREDRTRSRHAIVLGSPRTGHVLVRRRELMAALGGAAVWPLAARAGIFQAKSASPPATNASYSVEPRRSPGPVNSGSS